MKKQKKLISLLLSILMLICSAINIPVNAQPQNVSESTMQLNQPGDELQIEGTNAVGVKLAEAMSGEMQEQATSDYYITGIEITDNKASVEYTIQKDCNIVVALYDDNGEQMLTSANAELYADEQESILLFETQQMPQNFLVKAFLLDKQTNQPLCEAYVNDEYTKEFQEFLAKTTGDFPEELVMNFNEDTNTNFAVFREKTIQIKEDVNSNILMSKDDEHRQYVIENGDEKVKSLKEGDCVYYESRNENLIIRVKSIVFNGSQATIQGTEPDLEHIFSYIKIEAKQDDAEIALDDSVRDERLIPVGTTDSSTVIQNVTTANFENAHLDAAYISQKAGRVIDINAGFVSPYYSYKT